MERVICVYSGGLDSTVLLHHCIREYDEVYALTFSYGQKHIKEIEIAQSNFNQLKNLHTKVKDHTILDLGFFGCLTKKSSLTNTDLNLPNMKDIVGHPQPSSYVPNRNMMMLSVAASLAEEKKATHIVYGAVAVDNFSYWDCTKEFVENINSTLHLNRMNSVTVHAPVLMKSKKEIVEMGVELGVDFSKTWTCYAGKEKACGVCPSCSSRIAGFKQAKLVDPIPYEINISW